eukprot:1596380-Amphidinium_carterae.1
MSALGFTILNPYSNGLRKPSWDCAVPSRTQRNGGSRESEPRTISAFCAHPLDVAQGVVENELCRADTSEEEEENACELAVMHGQADSEVAQAVSPHPPF